MRSLHKSCTEPTKFLRRTCKVSAQHLPSFCTERKIVKVKGRSHLSTLMELFSFHNPSAKAIKKCNTSICEKNLPRKYLLPQCSYTFSLPLTIMETININCQIFFNLFIFIVKCYSTVKCYKIMFTVRCHDQHKWKGK